MIVALPDLSQLPPDLRAGVERFVAAQTARLELENRALREHVRLLQIRKFGPSSDKLSDLQLDLLEREPFVTREEVQAEVRRAESSPAARTPRVPCEDRRHPGREPLPAHLERRIEIIHVPGGQCACEHCGKHRPVLGYEVSEYLEMEPIKFFVREVRREKLGACACQDGVVCAPVPVRILPKSKLGDELIVELIDQKFGLHVPVYRQCEAIFRNAGVDLSRQTVCSVMGAAGGLLVPIVGVLKEDLLRGGYVQADETRFGVQTHEKPGKNHTAQIWQYGRPGGPVVFDFRMSRGRAGPSAFLKGFQGYLQSDGYQVYRELGPGITYLGCLSHVRRKFVEAHKLAPQDPLPREIVDLLGEVYAVEAEAREAGATTEQRHQLRQARSKALMERLHARIEATQRTALPKSMLGRACKYALGQWKRVLVYLEDGRLEIDNNWAENAIRPVVLGRKNFLHIGSEWMGPNLAAIWTIYGTCQRLGKNPRAYLRSVLPRLGDWPISRVAELSPLVWQG